MHVSEADIVLYFEGRLVTEEKERVELHLAECPVCTDQLAAVSRLDVMLAGMGHTIDKSTRARAERSVQSGIPYRPGFFQATLKNPFRIALAGGLSGIVILVFALNVGEDQISEFREPEPVIPLEILTPEDGSTILTRRNSFSWRSVAGAPEYRFLLYDFRGVTLWTKELADTTLEIPLSVVLEPGKSYLWRVETLFPNGEQTRSTLNAFTYPTSQ